MATNCGVLEFADSTAGTSSAKTKRPSRFEVYCVKFILGPNYSVFFPKDFHSSVPLPFQVHLYDSLTCTNRSI